MPQFRGYDSAARAPALKVEAKNRVLGRIRFSADEPDERETLWIHSTLQPIHGASDAARAREFRRIAEAVAGPEFLAGRGWTDPIYETSSSGDLLMRTEKRDSDEAGDVRTVMWMRLSLRGAEMITSVFQLCTGVEFLDAPEQRQSLEFFEREIRAAAIASRVPGAR